ncbi:unnamed protein product [marine sediment metagenome]|uniref:Peptidase M50 domain-containing protein n=1 Tax=marine sediment metagenome TaxID=412755 RepID=X1P503_9ZZZZ
MLIHHLGDILSGHAQWDAILGALIAITIALTVHEFAHAKVADMAGDPTPRMNGRVSLNPLDHYDPMGTTMILLFGIGWGKPVPINPAYFRNPRRDEILVSFAGPGSNFIMAILFAIPLRFGLAGVYASAFHWVILINLLLGFFNLIPIYPLDGSHILSNLLPVHLAQRLAYFYQRYGIMLLLLIIFFGVGKIVFLAEKVYDLLVG